MAVLPFLNLSPDPEQAYFSDGITEDLISHLSRIERLRVTSRTSVMRFRESELPLAEIARELGVTHLVEGSVRREEDQVRINAQLIDAGRDAPLWSESYDRQLTGIFRVQGEIADHISRALEVDPLSPVRHVALGSLLFDVGDLDGAGEALERAVALAPDHPGAAYLLANVYRIRGEAQRAEARVEALLAAAPDHPGTRTILGRFLTEMGRDEEAEPYLAAAPDLGAIAMARAIVWKALGREELLADFLRLWDRFEEGSREEVGSVPPRGLLGAQALRGDRDGALATLRHHWRSGLHWIEDPPQIGVYFIDHDPVMRGIAGDPEFEALMAEIRTGLDSIRALVAR